MTATTAAPERFDIGRVFSAGFAIVGRRPLSLIVLTLIFGYLPAAAALWLSTNLLPAPTAAVGVAALGPALQRAGLAELVAVFAGGFSWVLQGAVAMSAVSDLSGRPLGVGEVLARALPRAPITYAIGVLATAAIILGTFALIVPGVLLALAWSVGGVAAMVENKGFGAFGRSAQLTRDNRLSLFVIFLVWGVVAFVVSLVARLATGSSLLAPPGSQPMWLTLGVQPLASAAVQVFSTATVAAAYMELCGVKEGLAATGLASLFD